MKKIKSLAELLDAREALEASLWHLNRAIEQRVASYPRYDDEPTEELRLAAVAAKAAVDELDKPAVVEVP